MSYKVEEFSKVWRPQRDWLKYHKLPFKEMAQEKKYRELLREASIMVNKLRDKEKEDNFIQELDSDRETKVKVSSLKSRVRK